MLSMGRIEAGSISVHKSVPTEGFDSDSDNTAEHLICASFLNSARIAPPILGKILLHLSDY
jgi:hypothetical protein